MRKEFTIQILRLPRQSFQIHNRRGHRSVEHTRDVPKEICDVTL